MAMPRLAARCLPQPPHRASLPRDTTGGSRGLRGGSAAAGGLTVKSESVQGAGWVGRAPECCRFGKEGGEPGPMPADGDGGGICHAKIQAQIALQGALVLALLTWPRAASGFCVLLKGGIHRLRGRRGVDRNQLRAH